MHMKCIFIAAVLTPPPPPPSVSFSPSLRVPVHNMTAIILGLNRSVYTYLQRYNLPEESVRGRARVPSSIVSPLQC